MILVDTSAWIEYDRGTGSPIHRRLAALIAARAPLALTEAVVMELLIGAQDARAEAALRRLLARFELLPFESPGDFELAVWLYRRCRAAGFTPRGTVDCLIAAVAWRTGAAILAQDRDLRTIARTVGIQLEEP